MDNKKQKTSESEDQNSETPTPAGTSEEEAKSEETSPDVIANEVKQSNQDQDSTQIATSSATKVGTPRNDNEISEASGALQPDGQIDTGSKSDNPDARWYVVHTYSGHENKVALTLKQRVESEHLEEKILDVLVPTQEKIEIKGGKKVNVKEKIFPGYILVKMVLDDASWLAVRTTQGVTSFVGMGNKPTPISDAEVATIVKFTQTEAPMYKQVFAVSDAVKIVDGPFADFIGKIDSVDGEKGKVRVLVSIFGRETPVELDFLQIKKI
ncbi:MAG: transcription termination/antitermination protein NusG [Candidatus Daviesbacteria bacterium]|nr:transcription termination/antitermination protein NusG [Candidatus Daviesbacteria bacterium]